MRARRLIPKMYLLFFVLGLVGVTLPAQNILVAFADGLVEYEENGQWFEVFIGDQIPTSSQVRLSAGAFVELDNGGTTIEINRPGVYALNTLVATARVARTNTGAGGRLGRLVNSKPPDTSTSAVGGVRASEAVDRDQTLWAGDAEAMALIRDGIDMIDTGDFQSAYWYFEEAYDAAQESEEAMVGFYYGFSSALLGNTAEAKTILQRYGPDAATPYYDDHALVLGQLFVQSAEFAEALAVLDSYLSNGAVEALFRQEALLLRGIALSGLGQIDEAKAALTEASALVPGTETAAVAGEILSTL